MTPLRRTPINRDTPSPREFANRRSTIPARSKKMQEKYEQERIPFVKQFLEDNPRCMFAIPDRCLGRATTVDEYINRSQGGEIVPGPKADAQGQRFHAACIPCHQWKTDHPAKSRERGWAA